MVKHSTSTVGLGMTLVLVSMLVVGYLVHVSRMSTALLSSDPDLVPANPSLMHYALKLGRSVYRLDCLGCHGENGTGDASRGVPIISDSDWLYGTGLVSDIERIVTYGIRSNNPKAWNLASMPGYARARPSPTNEALLPLSPAEIRDVIEFLVDQQHRSADVGAAARGALVYQGVGGCYDCHSPDAKGDEAIGAPNLTDPVTLYGNGDRGALYDSIANGRQGVCPSWIKVLSPASIREVAVYVYQLSHSQ